MQIERIELIEQHFHCCVERVGALQQAMLVRLRNMLLATIQIRKLYLNMATKKVDIEHLGFIEVKKVNSAALYKVIINHFKTTMEDPGKFYDGPMQHHVWNKVWCGKKDKKREKH